MDPLKMYFLLKMGTFHCYVSLPEGRFFEATGINFFKSLDHRAGDVTVGSSVAPFMDFFFESVVSPNMELKVMQRCQDTLMMGTKKKQPQLWNF